MGSCNTCFWGFLGAGLPMSLTLTVEASIHLSRDKVGWMKWVHRLSSWDWLKIHYLVEMWFAYLSSRNYTTTSCLLKMWQTPTAVAKNWKTPRKWNTRHWVSQTKASEWSRTCYHQKDKRCCHLPFGRQQWGQWSGHNDIVQCSFHLKKSPWQIREMDIYWPIQTSKHLPTDGYFKGYTHHFQLTKRHHKWIKMPLAWPKAQ